MKKSIFFTAFVLATLSIASCVNELEEVEVEVEQAPDEIQGVYMTFDASPAEDVITKTNLVNEDGVYKFPWTVGDAISLFYGSGTNGGSKFSSNATEQTYTTKFSGIIDVITGGEEDSTDDISFWAIYPYDENNSCDGSSLTFTLASEQTAVAEGISPNTCPTIAKASGLHLGFYQTCGYFRFTVSQPGIKQVIFTNASGAPIAGTMTCSFGDDGKPVLDNITGSDRITVNAPNNGTFATGSNYYVIMAPVTMSNGMYVTYVKDDTQATYTISSQVPIKRKVGNRLENRDANLDWELRDYCLTFSMESGSNTLSLDNKADYGDPNQPNVQYSYDKIVWKDWDYSALEFSEDRPLYIRGENSETGFSHMDDETQYIVYSTFKFGAPGASVDGDIMSLISYDFVSEEIYWDDCFYALFRGAPIVKGPELPAMDLSVDCYAEMFSGCTLLEEAPELPADGLSSGCYAFMFSGCTSLTKAPVLPAEFLMPQCYHMMFWGCTNLNYVEAYFTTWYQKDKGKKWTDSTSGWLNKVAATGTFIRSNDAEWVVERGINGIPEGWTVQDEDEALLSRDYLCFTASRANVTIGMEVNGDNWTVPSLEYSRDKVNWYEFVPGTTTVTLQNVNDKVYFRGDNRTFSVGSGKYVRFTMSNGDSSYEASVAASGNIMSLVDKTCTSTTIPNSYAFQYLFDHCILMTSAPSLPATTLTEGCYNWMFGECNALSSAPALPATTLAEGCYGSMFMNSGLTSAPSLPATTMAEGCYSHMFYGTRLTSAPALPATTLAKNCYMEMFLGNPFTTAPSLPATTLAEGCYDEMFSGCTSLVTGPRIYAQTLAPRSCYGMFSGCSSLSSLEVDFTAWDNTAGVNNATHFWMANVPSTGTFKCPEALPATRDASHILSSWAVQNPDITSSTRNYLCFTASSANVTIGMEVLGDNWTVPSLELSPDGVNWYEFIPGSTSILLDDVDNQVFFRGNNDTFSVSDSKYVRFVMSSNGSLGGIVYVQGNVMSLVDKTCTSSTIPNSYAFAHLFENCSILDCADSELLPAMTLAESCYKDMFSRSGIYFAPSLPATTLAEGCYSSMFGSCANLFASPSLPATTLAKGCYASMFAYSGLNTAPALSATTLAESCYSGMFESCVSLTSVPNDYLPVTTLAKSCYEKMFMSCSGLTSAPALPATTMAERSYYAMFYSCNNLASAPALPATTLAKYCYSEMFFACSSLTAAPTLPAEGFAEGCYDWMFYNCTALESAGINATGRLSKNCCSYMFYGCSSLQSLEVAFGGWDATEGNDNATYKWVDGVSATGTFYCPRDLADIRDESHIPLNWTKALNHKSN